jgi:hypothetical protein
MVYVPLRADNAYMGFGKQSVQGTAVAPTTFLRWMDGTAFDLDLKASDLWEGDGTRRLAQIIKNHQRVKIKHVCSPRMNEMAMLESATMGTGSDSLTAATVNTTLSSASSIGATTISVAANTGLTGSTALALVLSPGTVREEIALFLPPVTGAGPYTLNVAAGYNGGQLKLAHNNADVVRAFTVHTLTDQADGDYYSIEVALGSLSGGGGMTIRVRDCKLNTCKVVGKPGMEIQYETEWEGIACAVQGAPATVTLEAHPVFLYQQGTWTLDGSSSSNDALSIESFTIERKNNLDVVQTEKLIADASIFGNLNCDVSFDTVFTSGTRFFSTYFGGPTGTADAQAINAGSFVVAFAQPDSFEAVTYTITTTHYTKVGGIAPKKDGKHFKQQVACTGVSNSGANTFVMQTAIQNSTTTAF